MGESHLARRCSAVHVKFPLTLSASTYAGASEVALG